MKLCDRGHDEVCYESKECPACLALDKAEIWEKECLSNSDIITELEKEIDELEDKNSTMEDK